MKNLIQYLKLWQKKRDELRIDSDVNEDWLEMQAMLDKDMPADEGSDNTLKKGGINLVSLMLITLSAAAMVYYTAKVVRIKARADHHKIHIHHKGHRLHAGNDSIPASDSLQYDDADSAAQPQVSIKKDTLLKLAAGHSKALNIPDTLTGTNTISANDTNRNKKNAVINKRGIKSANSHFSTNLAIQPNNQNARIKNQLQNSSSYQHSNDVNDNVSQGNLPMVKDVRHNYQNFALLEQPRQNSNMGNRVINTYSTPAYKNIAQPLKPVPAGKDQGNKVKNNQGNSRLDWGILIGANSSGSFTSRNLNSNFYGKSPVDFFTGVYGTYNLNDKWGIGLQVNLLSAQLAKGGTYTRSYGIYTDSVTTLKYRQVSDSKKIYSVQIPLYATYKLQPNISIKGGPVISLPVKQFNTTTLVDTVSGPILNPSRYDQKIDYGFTGGISYRYKWIIFEAGYLKGLSRHSITSDSLIHKSTNNTFQFTIKVQLGGNKK